jgi:CTP:phosphocholine cytidylyltransferase-like protein
LVAKSIYIKKELSIILRMLFSCIIIILTISIILSFFLQSIDGHPTFAKPFQLNYTSDLNNRHTLIDYDSKTKILSIKIDSPDSRLNKQVKLTAFQDHDLEHKLGELRILDLNFTHYFCSDSTLCEISTLQVHTPTRSSKLTWTIDSEDSIRKLNSLEQTIRNWSNLNKN